jgi:hypothetical protein
VSSQDAATLLAGGQQQPLPFIPPDSPQQGFGPDSPFFSPDPFSSNPFFGGIPPGSGLDLAGLINLFLSSFIPPFVLPATPQIPPGGPPSVKDVRFTGGGFHVDDQWTVEWNVRGDESQIDSYVIDLVEIQPDQAQPVNFNNTFSMGTALRGQHRVSLAPVGLAGAPQVPRFLRAHVTAVPSATAVTPTGFPITPNFEASAARMVFPQGTDLSVDGQPMPDQQFDIFLSGSLIPTLPKPSMPFSEPKPPDASASVWTSGNKPAGEFFHQNGATLFEAGKNGGEHLFMRPQNHGDELGVQLRCKKPPFGPCKLVADLGFRGRGGGTVNATIVGLEWFADPQESQPSLGTSPLPNPVTMTAEASSGHTTFLVVPVDPTQVPGLSAGSFDHLRIKMRFSFSGVTPAEPPVLYGVRLIP